MITDSQIYYLGDKAEKAFRNIISYFLINNIIKGNIIDSGSWIGDNTIPWAKQTNNTIYSIDPSNENIEYINKMAEHNSIKNIKTIQKALSDKIETISCNPDSVEHFTFTKGTSRQIQIESTYWIFI